MAANKCCTQNITVYKSKVLKFIIKVLLLTDPAMVLYFKCKGQISLGMILNIKNANNFVSLVVSKLGVILSSKINGFHRLSVLVLYFLEN